MAKRRTRFGTWCKRDPDDETKIVYEFRSYDGNTMYFTSDDSVSYSMIHRVRDAWIDTIEYVSNEFSTHWYAKLYEE